jgi:hypothetical protein
MTEPSAQRPVPGPSRPGPDGAAPDGAPADLGSREDAERFAGLDERPVTEHVPVFEAEHERLRRELGTIDQL